MVRHTVTVSFSGSGGQNHTYQDTFAVIDCAHDLIIGLPAIVKNVLPLFTESLYEAKRSLERSEQPQTCNHLIPNPWSFVEEEAPEDNAPVPCSFSEPIHYLSMSHDEAIEQYLKLLDTHVSPEFASKTKVLELLKSPLGIAAFVPQNWNGIKMEPVTLRTKDTMPETYKPPARNVNPKIWDVARKEFDRLPAAL